LADHLKTPDDWKAFTTAVADADARYFAALPGFVGAAAAVSETSDKADVLQKLTKAEPVWGSRERNQVSPFGLR
jgi:hypothetical protein